MRLIIYICFAISSIAYGQEVTKSTSQGWSGGVCCRSGVSYVVHVKLPKAAKNVELKSVYLRGEGWLQGGVYSPSGDNQNFQVSFGTYRDSSNRFDTYEIEPIVVKENRPDPIFKGDALIVLSVDGKDVNIEVEGFEGLPHLAYP